VFDREAIKTVLALRTKYAVPQRTLTDPEPYYDARYLAAAEINSEAAIP
jgi:hypothetical protein